MKNVVRTRPARALGALAMGAAAASLYSSTALAILCSGWPPSYGLQTFSALPGSVGAVALTNLLDGTDPNFPTSAYSIDCGTGYVIGGAPVCRVNDAPVVDMTFVNNLRNTGYTVYIGYSLENQSNDRAIVSWAKDFGSFSAPCPPGIVGNTANGADPNACGVGNRGFARLQGATWTNVYGPITACTKPGMLGSCSQYTTYPFGSDAADQMAAFPEPDRAAATIVASYRPNPVYDPFNNVACTGSAVAGSMPFTAVILDAWLATPPGTPPISGPPLPPPPFVPPTTAPDIAFGGVGSGSAVGALQTGGQGVRGGVPFDFTAFCNMPDPQTGGPRNPAWIASCLANAGR